MWWGDGIAWWLEGGEKREGEERESVINRGIELAEKGIYGARDETSSAAGFGFRGTVGQGMIHPRFIRGS